MEKPIFFHEDEKPFQVLVISSLIEKYRLQQVTIGADPKLQRWLK